jgi:hypothetical protein
MDICEWWVDGAVIWGFNHKEAARIYELNTGKRAVKIYRFNHEDTED